MESIVQFTFREKLYSASYVVCDKDYPTYIYISFKDVSLVREFGEEIVIHSSGGVMLSNHIYTEHRLELYTAIFEAVSAIGALSRNSQSFKQK